MDDNAIRDGLRLYVMADPPPSMINADQLLLAGRRSRRRRQAVVAIATITAGLVTIGAGLAWPQASGSVPTRPPASIHPPTSAQCPGFSTWTPYPSGPERAGMAAMTSYLQTAVRERLPATTLQRLPCDPPGTQVLEAYLGPRGITADAAVIDVAGRTTVRFIVTRTQAGLGALDADNCRQKTQCTVIGGADLPPGYIVTAFDSGHDPNAYVTRVVYAYVGNTRVEARATNFDQDGRSLPRTADLPRERNGVVFDLTTLIQLATAAQLVIYP